MKKEYECKDLDCAHCADEMERAAAKVEGVKSVRVNFLNRKMTLEADEKDFSRVEREVLAVCRRVEPDCAVLPFKKRMEPEEKGTLIEIAVAAVLFLAVKAAEIAGILEEGEVWTLLLYLPSYFLVGGEVIFKAVRNLFHGKIFDENFLMALATVGAVGTGEYSEAVAVMLLYQIGEFFQELATRKSRRSVTELMDLCPDKANLCREDGTVEEVLPGEVPVGSRILVRPGEKVPLDGVIAEGESFLDTAPLTGESRPKEALPGVEVMSGFINMNGAIFVESTKNFEDSSANRILEMIENSGDRKSRAENFISRFARIYTPVVVIGALLLALLPPLFGGEFSFWLHKAITCLVISCPCALVISVPLAFFGGIGGAGSQGILVKGADALEKLAKAGTCIFDKTGTLTKGNFIVTAVHPEKVSEEALLELAATCENYSNHPISQSLKAAFPKEIDRSRVGKVRQIPGRGVAAVIDGREVFVGSEELIRTEAAVEVHECVKCRAAGTVVHLAEKGEYLGHIVISDEIKEDAAETVSALRALGVADLRLFSGDRADVAESVGRELGIETVESALLPQDKLSRVAALCDRTDPKSALLFVGDGMNDVPVLARADVGIAMGGIGTDAAIEAADVVLIDDQPKKIPQAVRLARKTLRIVYENIVFAIGVKLAVLIPNLFLGEGSVPLFLAVFADVGVCLLAILNSARALRAGKRK